MSLEDLHKLSKAAFKKDGSLRTFGEQLFLFERGLLAPSDLLIVSDVLHLPFDIEYNNLPITMSQNIARKILVKHNISPVDLEDLVELVESSPLGLKGKFSHLNVILDKQIDNNNMMSFLEVNSQKISFFVNDIRSIYFDNVLSELNNSLEHGCEAYTNIKTKEWLQCIGVLVPKHRSHYIRSLPQLSEKTKAWLERYADTENTETTV
jgi:hypothetical protein